jgi:hypothetical protein
MIVFVEESAEAIVSAGAQKRESCGIGELFGQWPQRPGVGDAPLGVIFVVVAFVLAQGVVGAENSSELLTWAFLSVSLPGEHCR